jgi:hypothetical protein
MDNFYVFFFFLTKYRGKGKLDYYGFVCLLLLLVEEIILDTS